MADDDRPIGRLHFAVAVYRAVLAQGGVDMDLDEIIEAAQVSQPTARTALGMLEGLGLVETERMRGSPTSGRRTVYRATHRRIA